MLCWPKVINFHANIMNFLGCYDLIVIQMSQLCGWLKGMHTEHTQKGVNNVAILIRIIYYQIEISTFVP